MKKAPFIAASVWLANLFTFGVNASEVTATTSPVPTAIPTPTPIPTATPTPTPVAYTEPPYTPVNPELLPIVIYTLIAVVIAGAAVMLYLKMRKQTPLIRDEKEDEE